LLSSRLRDVPDYQRGYAWEAEQLGEFWEDLELIEPGGRHYTGTVVLRDRRRIVQDEAREVPLECFDVVDGQQRLTTCALLLDRLYDHLDALHDDEAPSARRRLLTCVVDGVKRPKLQLGADLRDYWDQVILEGKPSVQGPRLAAQRRLSQAADFVETRLAAAEQECVAVGEYRKWLRRMVGKVTGALQFTLYVVDDNSEVGVIFETLNQRGKELTELEKTKNYLLYLASLLDDGPRGEPGVDGQERPSAPHYRAVRVTRHPIYTGLLGMLIGATLLVGAGQWIVLFPGASSCWNSRSTPRSACSWLPFPTITVGTAGRCRNSSPGCSHCADAAQLPPSRRGGGGMPRASTRATQVRVRDASNRRIPRTERHSAVHAGTLTGGNQVRHAPHRDYAAA
jgi:hypothetical protein